MRGNGKEGRKEEGERGVLMGGEGHTWDGKDWPKEWVGWRVWSLIDPSYLAESLNTEMRNCRSPTFLS